MELEKIFYIASLFFFVCLSFGYIVRVEHRLTAIETSLKELRNNVSLLLRNTV